MVQIRKEATHFWGYKVGNNAYIANYVILWKIRLLYYIMTMHLLCECPQMLPLCASYESLTFLSLYKTTVNKIAFQ